MANVLDGHGGSVDGVETQPRKTSMINLSGKNILVTGASRGIGRGVAEGFIEAGANVQILADGKDVFSVADALGVVGHRCDITDVEQVSSALSAAGPLDVLVNNAGLERITPLEDDDPTAITDTFRRIMDINVTGSFLVAREALKTMPDGASIINTASIWGKVAPAHFSAYAASKHAVIGLTRTWARELASRSIRVNAVCPGWVKTEASMLSLQRMCETEDRNADKVLAEIVGAQDLPGLMEPKDVAGLYVFLACPLAASITGQSIIVDRGEVQG